MTLIMKLVIMIPCLNEEDTLPLTLKTIPKTIAGISSIEVVVIDDGCTDKTVEVARELGVKEFVHHARNRGLAHSLRDGIQRALELGADILVLTDGDNQYPQERIPDLIKPILEGTADTVIADRQTHTIDHFSPTKKLLQKVGTWVMNQAAGTNIPDATSGFRAYSKEAAIKLNLVGRFNFAAESTIQAANKRLGLATITIKTNPKTRESRLFKTHWEHVRKSAAAIFNAFTMYKPYTVFLSLGGILFIIGAIPFVHYLWLVLTIKNSGGPHHIQSLLTGAVFLIASFFSITLGIIANLIRINRSLIEDVLETIKRQQFK
jgi:glycosyltransferase involved in cell wall biosynthesis